MPSLAATPLAVAAKHEQWTSAGPSSAVSSEGPFLRIVTAGPTSAEDTTLKAHSKLVKTQHSGSVDCIAGSIAHNLVAYAESLPGLGASRVFVVDTETDALVATIVEEQADQATETGIVQEYVALALSHDGKFLAMVEQHQLVIADLEAQTISARKLWSGIRKVAFNPNNSAQIVSMGKDEVVIWSVERSGHLCSLQPTSVALEAIPGTDIVGRRRSVAETLSLDSFIDRNKQADAVGFAFGIDDSVYIATTVGQIYKVDTEKCYSQVALEASVTGPSAGCEVVDGHLVVFTESGKIRYFDIDNALASAGVTQLAHKVTSATLAGTAALVAATPGAVSIISAAGPKAQSPPIELEKYHSGDIIGVGLAGDAHAVTFDKDGTGFLWTCSFTATNNIFPVATVTLKGLPSCMSTCPVGPAVAVGTTTGYINVYDLSGAQFRLIWSEKVHSSAVTRIEYTRTGEYIFSTGGNMLVTSRGKNNCQVLGYVNTEGEVLALSTSSAEAVLGGVRVAVSTKTKAGSRITTALFPPIDRLMKATPLPKKKIKHHEEDLAFAATSLTFGRQGLWVNGPGGQVVRYEWNSDVTLKVNEPSWFPGSAAHSSTLCASACGNVVASLDDLGIVMLRSSQGDGAASPVTVIAHKGGDGAVASRGMVVNARGTGAVTIGHRGEMVMWKLDGAGAVTDDDLSKLKIELAGEPTVTEDFDDGDGKRRTAIDQLSAALEVSQAGTDESEADGVKKQMLDKVDAIRTQLMTMIEDNATKPDLEQLDRDEFQLDLAEKGRMEQNGDKTVKTLKEDIEMQILAQQFLRHQIKKECWDSMEVKGKTLYAFKSKLQLANFPLRERAGAELDELKKVRLAREIERQLERSQRKEIKGSGGGGGDGEEGDDDDEDEDDEDELYDPLTLYCPQRKRAQIAMLSDALYQRQVTYNKDFEIICQDKDAVKEQIKSKNHQISKVVAELKLGGATGLKVDLFVPKSHTLERPERLLVVDPADIKVTKVLNAQELVEKAEQDKLDAAQAARDALDNPRERGVQEMLDGRLEGKGEEVVWETILTPEFITTIPEEQWSEQQEKEKGAHDKIVEEREELRDKRRKLLNTDLTALQTAVENATASFDERLQQLFHTKIRLQQLIIREELIILKLVKSLRDEQASIEKERKMHATLLGLKEKRQAAAAAATEAEVIVDAFEEEYQVVRKEDIALDKTFKARLQREFPNQVLDEFLDPLHKLFKRRPRRSKHTTVLDTSGLDLDEEVDYPEGLDRVVWDKMVEFRVEKIDSERNKRAKEDELAERRSYFTRRKNEKDTKDLELQMLVESMSDLRTQRLNDTLDLEVMVNIKQGQVEVTHVNDFEPDYETAVLIDRSKVEELNAEVRRLAEIKVAHMTERMKFRKGIHILEWEHERLDRAADDLVGKTKDIQMLRVTRHMTLEGGDNGNREDKSRKDNETLERTIRQQKVIMEQMLAERERQVRMIKDKVKKLNAEGTQLEPKFETLATEVDERSMMCAVQLQATGGVAKTNGKLREAAQRRRFVDTVKAQAEEISFLRDELERRRMKTFPAFVPGQRVAF